MNIYQCLILAIFIQISTNFYATTSPAVLQLTNSTENISSTVESNNSSDASGNGSHVEGKMSKLQSLAYILEGRIVLATTLENDQSEWGLTQELSERACTLIGEQDVINRSYKPHRRNHRHKHNHRTFYIAPTNTSIRNVRLTKKGSFQGHLLSISSNDEIVTIVQLLKPLPKGAYWTGGKITKRLNTTAANQTNGEAFVELTWTDKRPGNPSVLGMTDDDLEMLDIDFTYCLALDLSKQMWQARECYDRLPYACLLTPVKTKFTMIKPANYVASNQTELGLNATTTTTTTEPMATTTTVTTTTVSTTNESKNQ